MEALKDQAEASGMDLEEVADLLSATVQDSSVLAGFANPEIVSDPDGQLVRVTFESGLEIDLLPIGDWSEYLLLCGGYSFEGVDPTAAVAGVGEIVSGRATVSTSGRWIFREATLRFHVGGEEWSDTRQLSGDLAAWESLLKRP